MPTDAILTKTEKNSLVQTVTKHRLSPTDFEWKEAVLKESDSFSGGRGYYTTEFSVSQLIHIPTGYYFCFGGFSIISCPGTKSKVQQETHKFDWSVKVSIFETWIKRLRDEVDAPDLWAIASQDRTFAEASFLDETNRPFSQKEQQYIAKHLQEIKRFLVETQEVSAENQRTIESRIDYLIAASQRMGMKDWHMTLMGIVATLVIAAVVTPDRAQELFRMIADAFLPLFQSLLQLEA